ncbi:MAG: U32 family peptidase [Candidatus Moranbacteria bacterium]|nr:U32 family peptidase [Candidatus Moranbacteria bacterium]
MELLAPAGSFKKLKYALHYGADAVYCGLPDFSLRGGRVNQFTKDDLALGIKYAHARNKKVYVTVNIYPHNSQLEKIEKELAQIIKMKPDALIVSDPGVIDFIRTKYSRQEIHLSTQANCINYRSIEFWKKQGVKRIILAREMKLKEVSEAEKKVKNIELEYFVHGAMCMAYSGRCMLSAWINQKSANQGRCTQPCRWPWVIKEGGQKKFKNKRPKKEMLIEEANGEAYIFNSKDLCLIEYLDELEKAGVSSLKIEGRNKSLYYLAVVVKYYRQALDVSGKKRESVVREAKKEFSKLGNREYTTGFAFGPDESIQNYRDSRNSSDYEMVGEVWESKQDEELFKAGYYSIFVHNAIFKGSFLDVVDKEKIRTLKVLDIWDQNKKPQESAHGGTQKIWYIKFSEPLDRWSILRSLVKKK